MSKKLNPKELAVNWKTRLSTAESAQTKVFKRISQNYDALYAEVKTESAPWRSKPFIPIMTRQIWNLVAKTISLDPAFQARVRTNDLDDAEKQRRADLIQKKLEYDWDNPKLDDTMPNKLVQGVLDGFVAGTGVFKVPYKTYKQIRKERLVDEYTGLVDITQEKVIEKITGCNDLIPVNIFNFYISPDAKSLYTAPWIIVKERKSLSELEKTNKEKGFQLYQNLDKVRTNNKKPTDTYLYDRSRNRILNTTEQQDDTVHMVQIYECYEDDMFYTFAEGEGDEAWILLRAQQNPYWHNKYPFAVFTPKPRPFNFWGESLYDTTLRSVQIYNDVFAQYLDAGNLSNAPMLIGDERTSVNDYVVEPAGTITYRGEKPELFQFPSPDAVQLQTTLGILEQGIEGVTVSQYATGLPNSNTDKTQGTATGITKLQEAAGDILSFYKKQYKQTLQHIGRMWHSNSQQFMIEPLSLEVAKGSEYETIEIMPADLQGEVDIIIDDASMQPATKEEQKENFLLYIREVLNLKQASLAQSQAEGLPSVGLNFTRLIEELGEQFGYSGSQEIIIDEQEKATLQQQMMMQTQQQLDSVTPQPQPQVGTDADAEVQSMIDELTNTGQLNPAELQGGV